jgi:hypothetical protein
MGTATPAPGHAPGVQHPQPCTQRLKHVCVTVTKGRKVAKAFFLNALLVADNGHDNTTVEVL